MKPQGNRIPACFFDTPHLLRWVCITGRFWGLFEQIFSQLCEESTRYLVMKR
jgi:hypothetical protein